MYEARALGWDAPDFVYVTGDAYVDHPSFGLAIISRVLEAAGYRVAMLPQPDWHTCEPFRAFGRPRIGFLVTAGVIDSMVNHYTAAKKRRSGDAYSPGGKAGHRPDRATIVYCNRIREAFGDVPIAIGGVEASLRRFAHYDYWDDRVRNSMLVDSGADVLMFGMGERSILKVAEWMKSGRDFSEMRVPGTCVMAAEVPEGFVEIPAWEVVAKDKARLRRGVQGAVRPAGPRARQAHRPEARQEVPAAKQAGSAADRGRAGRRVRAAVPAGVAPDVRQRRRHTGHRRRSSSPSPRCAAASARAISAR